MSLFDINRRYTTVAICALVLLWCWIILHRHSLPVPSPWHQHGDLGTYTSASAVGDDIFDFPPLDSTALRDICEHKTHWNANVTFMCSEPSGNVAEVRNAVLSCVRYAITAGAGLVMPRLSIPDVPGAKKGEMAMERRKTSTKEDQESLGLFFDEDHFVSSLALSCPQLRIYGDPKKIANTTSSYLSALVAAQGLIRKPLGDDDTYAPAWRELFDNWVEQYLALGHTPPIVVELAQTRLQYPIYSDPKGLAHEFGKILKIRADCRRLATAAIAELSQSHSLDIEPEDTIFRHAFLAVHFDTRLSDVDRGIKIDKTTSNYTTQSKLFLSQAAHLNTSIIYISSPDPLNIDKFVANATTAAHSHNFALVTKHTLLQHNQRETERLDAMSPDQQSLVDFLIMSKASVFAGVGHSSLAWNIALARHLHAGFEGYLDGPLMLNDDLSRLYGPVAENPQFARCMWP